MREAGILLIAVAAIIAIVGLVKLRTWAAGLTLIVCAVACTTIIFWGLSL